MINDMITDLNKSQDSFDLKIKRDNNLIKEADSLKESDFQYVILTSANRILDG